MATPRKRYRVDVIRVTPTELHALVRTQAGLVRARYDLKAAGWCPHHVRATSTAGAQAKAIALHTAQCEDALAVQP